MVTTWSVFGTFAVWSIVIVSGFGPQLNLMIPPAATALTTADDVQLAGVPLPTTWFGTDVFTASPVVRPGIALAPVGVVLVGCISVVVFVGGAAEAVVVIALVATVGAAEAVVVLAVLANVGAVEAVVVALVGSNATVLTGLSPRVAGGLLAGPGTAPWFERELMGRVVLLVAPGFDFGVSAFDAADQPAELAAGAFFFGTACCLDPDAAATFLFLRCAALTLVRFAAIDGAPRPREPARELTDADCLLGPPTRSLAVGPPAAVRVLPTWVFSSRWGRELTVAPAFATQSRTVASAINATHNSRLRELEIPIMQGESSVSFIVQIYWLTSGRMTGLPRGRMIGGLLSTPIPRKTVIADTCDIPDRLR